MAEGGLGSFGTRRIRSMKNEHPLCSVIVLNYNGRQHLQDCLSSLKNQTCKNFETILVDNASQDDSVYFVRKNFPNVKIVRNRQNSGTAGGFNFGSRYSNAEYLLFLANDTEVEPNLFEEMMKEITKDPSIAICSAKMLRFFERDKIDYAGIKLDIYGFPYIIGHKEKDDGQYNLVRDTIATGTCLLIKRKVFEKIGGFDDEYFTFSDEVDLCWRAKLVGYRSIINPHAKLYHKAGATLKKTRRSRLRYMSERNIFRMLVKNYSALTLIKVLPQYIVLLLGEVLFYLGIKRGDMALAIVKAVLWNVQHLKGTLFLRRKIQKMRVVGDNIIQKEMIKKSVKIDMFGQWRKGEFAI
jgi:GT2 family glycosyltransferase